MRLLENGYESQTTFWSDFSIAEAFGYDAIVDTFNRAFEEWKDNYVFITELAIVTNLKCWDWYEYGNEEWSKFYADAYYQCREYALDHLKGNELVYYINTTD